MKLPATMITAVKRPALTVIPPADEAGVEPAEVAASEVLTTDDSAVRDGLEVVTEAFADGRAVGAVPIGTGTLAVVLA